MPPQQSRRWVFTLNNYADADQQRITTLFESDDITYGVYGRELGDSGTPHLQGFVICKSPRRLRWLRTNISGRAHFEVARGTSAQASAYCEKDGDSVSRGTLPVEQGRRTDIERYRDWVTNLGHVPSQRAVAREFPGLWLRYPRLVELGGHLTAPPSIVDADATLRQWQFDLDEGLRLEPDDRSILFYVDVDGGKGKSWFVRHQVSNYPDETQFLSVGKRDDLAYAIDETKRVFLFDLPRGSMEHFQYSVLEKLKDQLVFSSKYASRVKVLPKPVHVVVFCNEYPDMTAMTDDRYQMQTFD